MSKFSVCLTKQMTSAIPCVFTTGLENSLLSNLKVYCYICQRTLVISMHLRLACYKTPSKTTDDAKHPLENTSKTVVQIFKHFVL